MLCQSGEKKFEDVTQAAIAIGRDSEAGCALVADDAGASRGDATGR